MSTFVNLAEVIYPVGAVYQSFSSTSPAAMFGGAWEKITGKFLYANNSTATGGSAKHQHTYGLQTLMYYGLMGCFSSNENTSLQLSQYSSDNVLTYQDGLEDKVGTNRVFTNKNAGTGFLDNTGSIYKHVGTTTYESTLPPYQSCYTWKRIA